MSDFDEPLSPQGEHRREQILELTLRAARQRRQRPRIVACAIATISTGCFIIAMHWFDRFPPTPPKESAPIVSNIPQPSQIVIGQIETDPTISKRIALAPTSSHWEHIGDDELIQSLADADQQAGLVKMDGQTILLTSSLPVH